MTSDKWIFNQVFQVADQIPGWYTEGEGRLLWDTVRQYNVGNCVEVGSFCGRSTVILASVRPVVAIDRWDVSIWTTEAARQVYLGKLREYGLEDQEPWELFHRFALTSPWQSNITPVRGRDTAFAIGDIGLLHLDHEHTAEAVVASLNHWKPQLRAKHKVVLHDWDDINVRNGAGLAGFKPETQNGRVCVGVL